MGRLEEALAASRRGLELDPLSPILQTHLGLRLAMRHYDKAIAQFRSAFDIDPHFPWAHVHLSFACIESGKVEAGIQAIENAAVLFGGIPFYVWLLGAAYASEEFSTMHEVSLR